VSQPVAPRASGALGPGRGASRPGSGPPAAAPAISRPALELLETLWSAGFAAYVVGGSLRDALLRRRAADWDLATAARPNDVLELFPSAVYENQFGTVAVRHDDELFEITTFRSDHDYADFRRPHHVEFGDSIELDLARRDFTVNAMAWGREGHRAPEATEAGLVDPFHGRDDIGARVLRAVGDPRVRFEEDALRMVRAVRLAATLGFEIEPGTMAAITERATLVEHLSGERLGAELTKLLAAPKPSVGLRPMEATGVLRHISAELAQQCGVAQNKIAGEDLWDHTLRTVDAAPATNPVVRLAALLHDIGKPATAADGHFYGHEKVGAELARAFLERLRYPKAVVERVTELVRLHMFVYEATWSDTAVRRFIGKVGRRELADLFALRAADNVGSGLAPDAAGLGELRRRVEEQLTAEVAIDLGDLAIDGNDLINELSLSQGPTIGRVLDELLERVVADPSLNDRPTLLLLAETLVRERGS
jgi:tRNA nucleotidyltransferase (CCA-adding enzyme)